MFHNTHCTIPQNVERQRDNANNQFIQMVLEEERRVKNLHAQEIQMTAENPRIRAQNETTDISAELKAQKHDNIIEQKRRQQLREDNLELRQLQIQLRAAVVCKQLAEQKMALDHQKEEQLRTKRREDIEFEKERLRCQEALREMELKERRKKDNFRGVLQGQMAETKERRRQEYEEVMKDREEMQKMLQRFKKEHEQELLELEKRKQTAKHEMEQFKIAQEEYKRRQMSEKMDEYERFMEMMEKRDEENRRAKEEKRRIQEQKAELSNRIGQQLYEIDLQKRRRENLLLDLLVEERNTKEDMRFKESLQQQFLNRQQMKMELERHHMEVRRRKQEREREEDDTVRAEQLRLQNEHDKKTALSEEKRRQRVKEHGEAIIQMIEEKRQQRAMNQSEELQLHEAMLSEERKKQALVEEERLRILKSVPVEVLRYLPAGVIKDTDRAILGMPMREKK